MSRRRAARLVRLRSRTFESTRQTGVTERRRLDASQMVRDVVDGSGVTQLAIFKNHRPSFGIKSS